MWTKFASRRKRLDLITRFKFKLKRRELEKFYVSFVLPILEYGDVLWGGSYQQDLDKLDRVHIRAMRVITGATERSSTLNLFHDLGWRTLDQRRIIHRLRWFYKIMNNKAPDFLVDLVPPTTGDRQNYSLRSSENITPYRCNRQYFSKSYFPTAINEWNALPIHIRQSSSLSSYNYLLNKHFPAPPRKSWYGQGDRFLDIHHSRLRIGCSKLKGHLHYNLHVEDDPFCNCGQVVEYPHHYFFICPFYREQRRTLMDEVNLIVTNPSVDTLLYGDESLSHDKNIQIIMAVQYFIQKTKRFV